MSGARVRRFPIVAWAVVVALMGLTALALEHQEAGLEVGSRDEARRGDAAQEAWRRWDGRSPISPALLEHLPLDPRTGTALVRSALNSRNEQTNRVLPRIATLPLLVRSWYRDLPLTELLDGELALLAWSRLPQRQLERGLAPLSTASGVALDPALEAEVGRRCPTGCPPMTGADAAALRSRLIDLLDAPDDQTWLAALDMIILAGPEAVPALKQRLEHPSPHARAQAFVALQRLLPEAERKGLRDEALEGRDAGLRLLAVLEAGRALDTGATARIEALTGSDEPPGMGVVARYVAGLLRETGQWR